nr:flavin reductase [Nocardioides pantholopis]
MVLVAATHADEAVGMLVNSFTSVSLDLPLVSVAFARTSTTWPLLRGVEQWGISVSWPRTRPATSPAVATCRRPLRRRRDSGDGGPARRPRPGRLV